MSVPAMRLGLGPVGRTAVIVIGGNIAGTVLARGVQNARGGEADLVVRLAAAAGTTGLTYLLTRNAKAALAVAAIGVVGGYAQAAASKATDPGVLLGQSIAVAVAAIVGTYLVVR